MALYLGIDMGGTATRWAVVDADGALVARGEVGGATGHLFNPDARTTFLAVIEAIAEAAPGPIAGAEAGITGLGGAVLDEARGLIAARFGVAAEAVAARDDIELIYRAVFRPGEGHLVSAGTGSIGLHLTVAGEPIRVGGRGILIDDGGSGTWIALTAIDRLYRRIDETGGPADAAVLADGLARAVGGGDWADMRSFVYGSDRGRIGTLARVVAEAADAGDPLAIAVLAEAVAELARLARALRARAGAHPVAFVGGVVRLHPSIRSGLARTFPDATFPTVDAALHAALAARERRG